MNGTISVKVINTRMVALFFADTSTLRGWFFLGVDGAVGVLATVFTRNEVVAVHKGATRAVTVQAFSLGHAIFVSN